MEEMLICYNKGCGQKFLPSENNEESCHFHPGGPIFHDALKGWSCCKKRSSDFTEFLNIPGCTIGLHSNVKPEIEKLQPKIEEEQFIEKHKEKTIKEANSIVRPSASDILLRLEMSVTDSLKQAIEERLKNLKVDDQVESSDIQIVQKGTSCKNNGCTATYMDESNGTDICVYHSGVPVFHEGMKYWSCCQLKTSDFNAFLSQSGCCTGAHQWNKKAEECEKKVACRFDWHQTGSFVTLSIFSKLPTPLKSWVEANQVKISINIVFDCEMSLFSKTFLLKGVIDPSKSSVKMMPSKVEINLKKLEPSHWPTLEL